MILRALLLLCCLPLSLPAGKLAAAGGRLFLGVNGDKGRAESYFIPAGTKADQGGTHDADAAKKMMQNLAAQNMRGSAEEANSTFVLFRVPNDDKLLEGGLRVGYKTDHYDFAAFVRNVTNDTSAVGGIDFNNLTGFINEPRTFGASIKASF